MGADEDEGGNDAMMLVDESAPFTFTDPWPKYWERAAAAAANPVVVMAAAALAASSPSTSSSAPPPPPLPAAAAAAAAEHGPAVVCQMASGMPWRRLVSAFTGEEADPEELPPWVVEAVIKGTNVVPKVRAGGPTWGITDHPILNQIHAPGASFLFLSCRRFTHRCPLVIPPSTDVLRSPRSRSSCCPRKAPVCPASCRASSTRPASCR